MKIAFLTDAISRNAGGVFDAVRRLVQSVAETNQQVRVFGVSDNHSEEDVRSWQPVSVETSPCRGPRSFGYAPELNRSLEAFDPDVIHPQGLWKYSSVASRNWSKRTKRPYIIHPHGMLDPWAVDNSRWKKRIAAALYEVSHLQGASCIRALCDSEAQSIRSYGLRNPICIIPNGIDIPKEAGSEEQGAGSEGKAEGRERGARSEGEAGSGEQGAGNGFPFNLALSSALDTPCSLKTLLYLGRLHPKKNLGPLIEAWAAVQEDSGAASEWTLAIAGWDQGGYEAELRKLASDLCPPTSVSFLGPKFGEQKEAVYRNCDAFILPSLSEGLPMVVLEAWAYAKPVLMTNECNLPEGFKANAALQIGTSADSIASGLRKLFEMNDSERVAMGDRGRTLAGEKFSWKEIGAEMRRVCEWAVNGGSPPSSVRFD